MERTTNCLAKLERMNKALRHEEPDRVPISDFFWGSFIKRWRKELNLPASAEPYAYYDLDWIVTNPNLDPTIRSFETIREDEIEVVVKTGFGATMRKRFDFQMPEFMSFDMLIMTSTGLSQIPIWIRQSALLKPSVRTKLK